MRWVCSRYAGCKAKFSCDNNGENFVDQTPDHNHPKPKFAKYKYDYMRALR